MVVKSRRFEKRNEKNVKYDFVLKALVFLKLVFCLLIVIISFELYEKREMDTYKFLTKITETDDSSPFSVNFFQ